MKIITPQAVLEWVKTKPKDKIFYWINGFEGCLFTQFVKDEIHKGAVCLRNGIIQIDYYGEAIAEIKFHDEFWGTDSKVSQPEAIKRLEKLSKKPLTK